MKIDTFTRSVYPPHETFLLVLHCENSSDSWFVYITVTECEFDTDIIVNFEHLIEGCVLDSGYIKHAVICNPEDSRNPFLNPRWTRYFSADEGDTSLGWH